MGNEESSLLQGSVAHTNDPQALLLWRLPLTRERGTHRGLSSSNRLQLTVQAELAGFATENKASSASPDVCSKKAARPFTQVHVLIVCLCVSDFLGGKKRPLMYEVGLNSPEPNSPKVTHCFRVLYLRVGLGLDGAVFIFLLSAALLISEKNNQPICSMLRNKNKIISTFQMKATTKKLQWQPDGVRKSIQQTHSHLGNFY